MPIIRLLIRAYQIILSPLISLLAGPGAGCRFEPTCSRYFLQACERHGAARGSWLGVKRICRCHPWGGQGFDPVPPPAAAQTRDSKPLFNPKPSNLSGIRFF
jgi:putative membrane protein insertion efficiency factor